MSLRSRQASSPAIIVDPLDEVATPAEVARGDYSDLQKKRTAKPRRPLLILLFCVITCAAALSGYMLNSSPLNHQTQESRESNITSASFAPMGSIIYGAKSKGDETSKLVSEAIKAGFRHIATGGFHFEYDEAGVGEGWKNSGVPRHELYIQTLFLAQTVNGYRATNCKLDHLVCPPPSDLSIEDQVHLSIKSSLNNLQTTYIDAVLVHNFRAKLQPYEETIQAWRVLEKYVDDGIVRHIGVVSVHDEEYLKRLLKESRIKPSIIQNRFHSNRGYDVNLRPLFKKNGMANQMFWILTGSAGGKVRNNDKVTAIAKRFNVSNQVVLYLFTMQIGGAPLIGPKNINHIKEDVDGLLRRNLVLTRSDLETMASIISKNLI